jgi:hypothetical protein
VRVKVRSSPVRCLNCVRRLGNVVGLGWFPDLTLSPGMRELTLPFVPAVFLQGTQWHTAYVLSGGATCRGTRLAWNYMQCTYDRYRLSFVLVSPVAADTASLDHD